MISRRCQDCNLPSFVSNYNFQFCVICYIFKPDIRNRVIYIPCEDSILIIIVENNSIILKCNNNFCSIIAINITSITGYDVTLQSYVPDCTSSVIYNKDLLAYSSNKSVFSLTNNICYGNTTNLTTPLSCAAKSSLGIEDSHSISIIQ